jgi:predicted type IV restriction endonuclease
MPSPPPELYALIERFDRNRDAYRSGRYNEEQARVELINPLFEALGWDVRNTSGNAEAYKDVVHEDAVKVGSLTKAPDYSFRIGGARKFFLEAKKPATNIRHDPAPAYQLRRYAWSAKLPLSILTDFEELAVYDCRVRPDKTDKPSTARIQYLTYEQYLDRWDDLASVFSKDAILKGSFDKYAEGTRGKKGTAEVDDAFLSEIEGWRDVLARHLALRNPSLTRRELNYVVQATIDRIIFLRICEDRGIEPYGQLQALLNGQNLYGRLTEVFRRADDRYNSGLFHFHPEKGRAEAPDEVSLGLNIDDKVLKDIISRLYYPDSPYEFSVLPADILGQVYEQFLGKVIRLTPGHQAKVEDKPEVKKAGGVYYTPTYIVDYIVQHTVGKLLEGKTPPQVSTLRILDPACGSGSFLIVAYQRLLDWHQKWYTENDPRRYARSKQPVIYLGRQGEWRLTTAERKRILVNNIYGVDIDPQAVEVTKLSLLLKVLEGESGETLARQMEMFQERALPDLSHNIQCGNSLIGPDFYQSNPTQANLFNDEEERYRINAFDWQAAFPEVMKAGGFDAVIGNPPYIRIQALKEWAPVEVEFYKQRYLAASKGNYDIYVVFVEKGLSLLNQQGRLGFILPHKFFNSQYGTPLRGLIAGGKHLSEVIHFGDQQVFAGATTYTCLMFLDKAGSDQCRVEKVADLQQWRIDGQAVHGDIPAGRIAVTEWNFTIGTGSDLFEKLQSMPVKLGDVAERIFQGLVTGADPVFVFLSDNGKFHSEATGKQYQIESGLMHPLCKGSQNIRRYRVSDVSKYILFPYEVTVSRARLLTEQEIRDGYPAASAYLAENRRLLESRERGSWKHDHWYAFGRSQNLTQMEQAKILTPSIASSASFTFDGDGRYYFLGSGGGGGGGYGVTLKRGNSQRYEYILGVLNSHLLDWLVKRISTRFRGGYFAYNRQYIEQLPVRTIDFADPVDVARHDQMVALVERMLALHRDLAAARTAQDKTMLQRQIEATDREIDRLVYELYGLTDEEIGIVEGRV